MSRLRISPPPLRESEDTYEGLGLSVYRRGAGGGYLPLKDVLSSEAYQSDDV